MNLFQKYKKLSGKSLSEIAAESKLTVTSISKIINYPWRTKIESARIIGNIIGMPKMLIEREWREAKQKHYQATIHEKLNK